jgi:D-alanyl-D-alanine carboxypeptidase
MLCGMASVVAMRSATAECSVLPSATLGRIDALCRSAVEEKRTAGLAIQVQCGDTVLFAKGYGNANIETGLVASPASVFRIGSISKQFTAAAVLLLSEERRLSLDDPLARFLPDFPRAAEVTIRQLLNHTSGIQNISSGVVPWVDYSTQQIIDVIRSQRPLYGFDPGTRWSYSNTG